MNKQLFLSLAVAAMAISCSKNEPAQIPGETEGTPIMLKGSTLSVDTKAPFEGAIGSSNTLQAVVAASLSDGDYSTPYTGGTMTFSGNAAVGYDSDAGGTIGPKVYPSDPTTNLYLIGLYPGDPSDVNTWDTSATTADYTFTGKEDVMAAPQVTTTKAQAEAGTYQSLTFDHKLTKLEIVVVAEDADAAAAWGKINEITLSKNGANTTFANKATVTLKDATTTFSGSAASWPTYEITTGTTYTDIAFATKEVALTTSPAKVAYTLVVPVTATGTADYSLSLKATRDGGTQVTKSDIALNLKKKDVDEVFTGSTAGNSFVVTLTFKALDIKATATVTPWVDGGKADADVN